MRKAAWAGLFALTSIVFANGSQVHAEPALDITNIGIESHIIAFESQAKEIVSEDKPKTRENITYTVQTGDSLSNIAAAHKTTWQRIFDKNASITNPDVINVGDNLTIPFDDEELQPRPAPVTRTSSAASTAGSVVNYTGASTQATVQYQAPVSGNTYSPGYCTWYAKNKRPDLPNNLGNANTWVSRAAAQGIPTGSTPRIGAIGQQGMHVVYVEAVNSDGSVTISEMNYGGWNTVNSRTVPASTFSYIY